MRLLRRRRHKEASEREVQLSVEKGMLVVPRKYFNCQPFGYSNLVISLSL
jgi:hypothetical protein